MPTILEMEYSAIDHSILESVKAGFDNIIVDIYVLKNDINQFSS